MEVIHPRVAGIAGASLAQGDSVRGNIQSRPHSRAQEPCHSHVSGESAGAEIAIPVMLTTDA